MNGVYKLTSNSTVENIIAALDQSGLGFLAFVDDNHKLIGVMTDGDLRRAVLKKNLTIDGVINTEPSFMDVQTSQEVIIAKLKQIHRRHMPLVDNNMVLKEIFSLDDIEFIAKENVVVIMAGGLGSRLGELTKKIPKPMLTVGGKPMLEHLVEQFREYGFYRFIFCVNYKKEVIKSHFGNGGSFGVSVEYVEEKKKLGTAGALSLIDSCSLNTDFFVVNADVMADIDFGEFMKSHVMKENKASMCVRQHEFKIPYGVVKTNKDDEIQSIEEKPSLSVKVNAGVYILSPDILRMVPEGEFFDMPTLFERALQNDLKASAYTVSDYWVDIGKVDDLDRARADLSNLDVKKK